MKGKLEDYSMTLAPGKTDKFRVAGKMFLCLSVSSAKVRVKFGSNGNEVPLVAGMRLLLKDSDTFDDVIIKNYDVVAASVTAYIGDVDLSIVKFN